MAQPQVSERLPELLDELRCDMEPGDTISVCRFPFGQCDYQGREEACPYCLIIEAMDPRTSEQIAHTIEGAN